jgi:hypothetical protein
MTTTIVFEPGRTYQTWSVCDHNCIVSITVASRTAKTVKTTEGQTCRISIYNGVEQVFPAGHYSMAPIIGADGTKTLLTDWDREALEVATAAEVVRNLVKQGLSTTDALDVAGRPLNSALRVRRTRYLCGAATSKIAAERVGVPPGIYIPNCSRTFLSTSRAMISLGVSTRVRARSSVARTVSSTAHTILPRGSRATIS